MGIRGLSTFFSGNPDLFKSYKLFDTPVVIDGNNLIHLLYFKNQVDCVFGGDYDKYVSAIKNFFGPFLECNVRPIVIFDGGYDKTNRKFQTNLLRSKKRLSFTNSIAKYGESVGNVLPINSPDVFRSILREMNISFAQCDFEADDQITALANQYKCPVLSEDSDFYIFDVLSGFIKLSSIGTTVANETVNGKVCKYLKCEIYHIDKFLSHFPGMDKSILPLFGTLVGNDFADANAFESFFSSIHFPKPKTKTLKIKSNQKRIIGLLSWLANFSLDEGINQVLCRFKKNTRDKMKILIDQSVQSYRTQKCNLTFVVEGDSMQLENILKVEGTVKTECGEELPIPFIVSFHEGNLPSLFLNIINHHRTFLPTQVEDTSLESSYSCSRYIRQVIYGLLLQHDSKNSDLHNECCRKNIEEYDRHKGSLAKKSVVPIFSLKNGNFLPNLCELYSLKKKSLQDMVSHIMDIDISYILSVPDCLQLLFAGINYWLKNCILKPSKEFLYALVINLVYFRFISKSSYCISNSTVDCPISTAISTIQEEDLQSVVLGMKKYAQKPTVNINNPLILYIIHCFSELQTCLLYSGYVNTLLANPFEQIKLQECFSGTLVYNLTKELISQSQPKLFVAELFKNSALYNLFDLLIYKILDNVPLDCIKTKEDCLQTSKKCRSHTAESKNCEKHFSDTFSNLSVMQDDFCSNDSVDIFI